MKSKMFKFLEKKKKTWKFSNNGRDHHRVHLPLYFSSTVYSSLVIIFFLHFHFVNALLLFVSDFRFWIKFLIVVYSFELAINIVRFFRIKIHITTNQPTINVFTTLPKIYLITLLVCHRFSSRKTNQPNNNHGHRRKIWNGIFRTFWRIR